MYFNRPQMKLLAKQLIKQDGVPPILKVTLVYLLLTTLLDSILSIFYNSGTTDLLAGMEEALTTGDYDAITNLAASFYSSNGGMFAIFCSIFMTLYCTVVGVGYYRYTMKIARNQPGADYSDLSFGLEILPKVVLLAVLEYVFIFLWSLLFVIPGIIAAYRYQMAFYALLDDPDISALEALNRSKRMMRGHKMELFVLQLSFLGWTFLAAMLSSVGSEIGYYLGLGVTGSALIANVLSVLVSFALYLILGLWLTAYQQITEVYFYDFVRNAYLNVGSAGGPGGPGGYNGSNNYGGHNGYNGSGDDWQNQNGSDRDPWN